MLHNVMMLIFSQSGLTSPIATALIIRMACLYFKWKLKRGGNAEAALSLIYRPRGTLNILLFVHMLSVCAFSWPFSSLPLSYSTSFFLSVLPWVSPPPHLIPPPPHPPLPVLCVHVSSAWWSGRWKYGKQEICSCPCQFCSAELW